MIWFIMHKEEIGRAINQPSYTTHSKLDWSIFSQEFWEDVLVENCLLSQTLHHARWERHHWGHWFASAALDVLVKLQSLPRLHLSLPVVNFFFFNFKIFKLENQVWSSNTKGRYITVASPVHAFHNAHATCLYSKHRKVTRNKLQLFVSGNGVSNSPRKNLIWLEWKKSQIHLDRLYASSTTYWEWQLRIK